MAFSCFLFCMTTLLQLGVYRVCSRRPYWRSKTIKHICMKMKFISQRNIVLLCYSSNMAAANTLYTTPCRRFNNNNFNVIRFVMVMYIKIRVEVIHVQGSTFKKNVSSFNALHPGASCPLD